jgi:DNA-binding Lrp family transcriptional regulator
MNKKIHYINETLKKKNDLKHKDPNKFDSNEIGLVLSNNQLILMKYWIAFQQQWINTNYRTFRDYDKYIILIYLISQSWKDDSDLFKFYSIDDYHSRQGINLSNISLFEIAGDLKMPKETIRRKLIELEKENIIIRKGQKIILSELALKLQKPERSIKTLSIFFEKMSILLSAQDWFGSAISREDIESYFKNFYTILWNHYFKMQIPFLVRWKTIFGDLESWVIWANIGINHHSNLQKKTLLIPERFVPLQSIDIKKSKKSKLKTEQYIEEIINMSDSRVNKSMRGVNASSIADISFIPRATVIRKLNKLSKEKIIKRNKRLEYLLTSRGELNKKIKDNYIINQKNIAIFVTEIFNLIKKSSLDIK